MSILDRMIELDFQATQPNPEEIQSLTRQLRAEAPLSILEICQDWSVLSLYLAAVLADQGRGTLTTFHDSAGKNHQFVRAHARSLALETHVAPIQSGRSYSWALQRLLNAGNQSTYDVCILNGKKSWDACGFDAVIADMLLRPGGLLILSGTNWSIGKSPYFKARPQVTEKYAADELEANPVQLVMDTILPHLGYQVIDVAACKTFGFARKSA